MSASPIRVLVVDDSAVVRGLVTRMLNAHDDVEVVGGVMNGKVALDWLSKHDADVAVLDVEMPVMDGLEALGEIQQRFPHVKVVMASSLTYAGAETTVRALTLGAAACVAKPDAASAASSIEQLSQELTALVLALGGRDGGSTSAAPAVGTRRRLSGDRPSVVPRAVVIGSSTGGPKALSEIMRALPESVRQPILIAQHMPPVFTATLATSLGKDARRPAQEAEDGMPIRDGEIYVAPGGKHLEVVAHGREVEARLTVAPPEHYCRPSVNPLFRTAARIYGPALVGLMLTGMGDDGIEATADLVDAGGLMLAQDEQSSVVWGMPGAVVKAGLAHRTIPLDLISGALSRVCAAEAVSL